MRIAIRFFDLLFSILGLIFFLPFLIIISIFIKINSKGSVFFLQKRVGKNNIDFVLCKFRTMKINMEKERSLTVGKDSRITSVGYFLRKYKLDEIPQLWNVLKGEMSLVGPRPELRKFVELYTPEQKTILRLPPGITDIASIKFRNENELLAGASDPEQYYIKEIMPIKIELNQHYIAHRNVGTYFFIIFNTLFSIFKPQNL
jgi:lipopolysaccharide/colanic/teichoic acid biosynthesis glycosyltransferase